MAMIGSNFPGGGIQPSFNRPGLSSPLTGAAGQAPAAANTGYGRQALGDVDLIMALLQLLKANGAQQSSCSGASGMDPSSLQAASGKGGGLKRAGGKAGGMGRPALAQMPAKGGAPALKQAAGK